MSIARAILAGAIDTEVEKRFTPQNVAVASFWIAVPGRILPNGQASAPYKVKVTCWRGMADVVAELHKGQVILVEGKLSMPSYQGQDGVQRKHFEVDAGQLSILPEMPKLLQPAPGSVPASGEGQRGQQQSLPQVVASQTGGSTPASNYGAPAPAQPYDQPAGNGMLDDLYTLEDIPF